MRPAAAPSVSRAGPRIVPRIRAPRRCRSRRNCATAFLGCAGDESWDTEAWSSDAPPAAHALGDRTPRAVWECLEEMEPADPVLTAPSELCGTEFGGGGGGGGGGGSPGDAWSCGVFQGYCDADRDGYAGGDAYWCHVDCEAQYVACVGACN